MTDLSPSPTRRSFLSLGVLAAGGAFATACGGSSDEEGGERGGAESFPTSDPGTERFGEADVGIANYALTLEYFEAQFYDEVVQADLLRGRELDVARRFGEQEQEHVEALTRLVRAAGGEPAERPRTRFPLRDPRTVLELAARLEDLGANAYLGQAAYIKDPDILAAALSIHTVEARHAAVLAEVTGQEPARGAYPKPVTAAEAIEAIRPYLAG